MPRLIHVTVLDMIFNPSNKRTYSREHRECIPAWTLGDTPAYGTS